MNTFASLEIFILSMLILAAMQLSSGIFALFCHYLYGKFSAPKADSLAISFILGAETLPALIFIIISFIKNLNFTLFFWIAVGVLFALGLAFFLFYFRRGRGTKLFISRKTAHKFHLKAEKAKTRSDAFFLGFTSAIPELIFTLPLFFLVFFYTTSTFFSVITSATILILFVLLSISPLFFTYFYFKTGHNLAEFMKKRFKNKSFIRIFVTILYFILAISIITFGVLI